MDEEVLAFVRERGEVAFPEINAAFDADAGAVFRACRRLARSGDVQAVLPLVYRPGDGPASDESVSRGEPVRASVNAVERLETDAEPRDGSVEVTAEADATDANPGADDPGDDGGFEWVGDA